MLMRRSHIKPSDKLFVSIESLDDAARISGGYVKQSIPTHDPERDRLISEALNKRNVK